MADIRAMPGSGGKVVPQSGAKRKKEAVVRKKRPTAKSIGSTLKAEKIVTRKKEEAKSSKIKVTRKKTTRTKSEAKEAKYQQDKLFEKRIKNLVKT